MKFGIWQGLLMIFICVLGLHFLEMLINEEHETENSKKKRKNGDSSDKSSPVIQEKISGGMANVVRKSHV